MHEDGATLAQARAIVEFKNRDLSKRILGDERGCSRLAFQNVDLVEGDAEPAQGETDLVEAKPSEGLLEPFALAVAGGEKLVEPHWGDRTRPPRRDRGSYKDFRSSSSSFDRRSCQPPRRISGPSAPSKNAPCSVKTRCVPLPDERNSIVASEAEKRLSAMDIV